MKSISFQYPNHLWIYSVRETAKGWNILMAGRTRFGYEAVQSGWGTDAQAACDMACTALTKYLDEQPRTVKVSAIDLDLSDI